MKKAVCAALALVLALALAGCGSKSYTFDDGPKTGASSETQEAEQPSGLFIHEGYFGTTAAEFRDFYNSFATYKVGEIERYDFNGGLSGYSGLLSNNVALVLMVDKYGHVNSIGLGVSFEDAASVDNIEKPFCEILDHLYLAEYSYNEIFKSCEMLEKTDGFESTPYNLPCNMGGEVAIKYNITGKTGILSIVPAEPTQYLSDYVNGDHFLMNADEFRNFYNSLSAVKMGEFEVTKTDDYIFYDSKIMGTIEATLLCDASTGYVKSVIFDTVVTDSESAEELIIPVNYLFDRIEKGGFYSFSNMYDSCGMENFNDGYRSKPIELEDTGIYVSYSVSGGKGSLYISCLKK